MLLILGSVNADLLFKVATLPRPGETVLCPSYTMAPGGKGSNQAAAAAKAGARTAFFGHLGDDAYGPVVRRFLVDAGIDCRGLATSDKPTAIAVIGVDEAGENSIIVASGANLDTSHRQITDAELGSGITLLCQNEIRPAETGQILRRAKAMGARTMLNLAPAGATDVATLDALDVLIVNEIEARMLTGDDATALEMLARAIARRHDLTCVVTLGAAGAMAVDAARGWRVGALPVTPVDTTGAGDAFVGVFAAALDAGADIPTAMHGAAVAAAISCEAIGAQSAQPDRASIDRRIGDLPPPTPMLIGTDRL